MPLYEYQCSKCGEKFEVLQKFSDAPLKRHKGCRGALHKLVSAAGLQFKGSGWYVNDYASKRNSEAKQDSNGESKSDSKTESKTESKSSESKSSESKSSESKSGASESKPAAKDTKAESKPAKTP